MPALQRLAVKDMYVILATLKTVFSKLEWILLHQIQIAKVFDHQVATFDHLAI